MGSLSLTKRTLITVTVMLIIFLGLAGIALDRAFVSSAQSSQKNELVAQVYALLSAIELDADGQVMIPGQLPESRLSSPASRLYALILDPKMNTLWRSDSSLGLEFNDLLFMRPGESSFFQVGDEFEGDFYYSFGIAWEMENAPDQRLTLIIINESQKYLQVIRSYRKELAFWLGLAAGLLLIIQIMSLRWSLIPLKKVTEELDSIERGQQKKITGEYPVEIDQLSRRINLFIENERLNLIRYRNSLGDLAHSLKTPLAVVRNGLNRQPHQDHSLFKHMDRMQSIIEYQLNRAAPTGLTTFYTPLDICVIATKIGFSLDKVYADKHISMEWDLDDAAVFYGDQDDLYEMLGNIMDNAFKWCRGRVVCRIRTLSLDEERRAGVTIRIEDDGTGILQDQRDIVLKRGGRVDEKAPGQGIGLCIANEIIQKYRGSLHIFQSSLGGAGIGIEFPSISEEAR